MRLPRALLPLLVTMIVIGLPAGRFAIHSRDVCSAIVHLTSLRGAYLTDDNGPLIDRDPAWGSLSDVLFSNVRYLTFYSGTRRLRFPRNPTSGEFPTRNPGLADPTPEEIVKLTDFDVRNIGRLTSLDWLDLQETDISDASLAHLASLTQLRGLALGPNVTPDGIERIQRLLPNCLIGY